MANLTLAADGNQHLKGALKQMQDQIDALSNATGVTLNKATSQAAKTLTLAQLAFTVKGLDGKFVIDITPPDARAYVYELRSALKIDFDPTSDVVSYPRTAGTHIEIQQPAENRYWQARYSADNGQSWSAWQYFFDLNLCGPAPVQSGVMRTQGVALVNSAATPSGGNPLRQDGFTTNIIVSASVWKNGSARIAYNAGHVDPGQYGYRHVYADDPLRRGGTVVYHTTTDVSEVTGLDGRVYMGSITTASGGGGVGSGGGSGACLIGDVVIEMADGTTKPMRDIQAGDALRSIDGGVDNVVRVMVGGVQPCFRFKFDNGTILQGCSSSHLLKYAAANWVQAFDVQVGDKLQAKAGPITVTEKTFIGDMVIYKMGLDRTFAFLGDGLVNHNMIAANKN